MKVSIVYSSRTGNTKRAAEAVKAALNPRTCIYFGVPDKKALEADFLFIGFWTDKGTCSEDLSAFLQTLHGKRVALFGTSGFGASQAYYDGIVERVSALLPGDCTVLGSFLCQGRMPESTRARYEAILKEKPEDETILRMLQTYEAALPHPDADDLEHAAAFARDMLTKAEAL